MEQGEVRAGGDVALGHRARSRLPRGVTQEIVVAQFRLVVLAKLPHQRHVALLPVQVAVPQLQLDVAVAGAELAGDAVTGHVVLHEGHPHHLLRLAPEVVAARRVGRERVRGALHEAADVVEAGHDEVALLAVLYVRGGFLSHVEHLQRHHVVRITRIVT